MAKNDEDLEDDELDEEEDDEDEADDDEDDEDLGQIDKATLLGDIADVLGDVYQDATEVDFDDGKELITIEMNDGTRWALSARKLE